MQPKTIKILYWTFTILFVSMMFMDGGAGVMWVKDGQDVMIHLGYPLYLLTIVGVAKILGAIAIIQNKFKTIK